MRIITHVSSYCDVYHIFVNDIPYMIKYSESAMCGTTFCPDLLQLKVLQIYIIF